ncbi:threonine dehydratase [Promicromonospora umidemergens]|uniref:Threonine ammonia-lyase n=1 Tax=Promicromonospora umidemergens TaxID=629679 RepID=A0ABP8XQM1_9MICO|nr:pyridoxal-phosphate dependent enzyme [Promicromonospora umidemergens]MCP2281988.1 threonine dehydratase [Promicromonospora umidemergens]
MTLATLPALLSSATHPTIADVLAAQARLDGTVVRTPVGEYAELDRATDAAIVVKHENQQRTGAFKARGASNLLLSLSDAERARGVVAYSTGNHAQGVAYAARLTGTACTIVMPDDPNPVKLRAVLDQGADVLLHGATFDDARAQATALAQDSGARLVGAANEPAIIAGVGTLYLELFQQAPGLDVLVVPVGGGSGAAAASLVAAAVAPHTEVIGVQSAASPAAHDSWHTGTLVERANATRAEGLAVGCGFEVTQALMREHLADFVLVSDDQITAAQHLYLTGAHTVAEGAGAAALAAVLADPERFAGRRVGVVCTGGNASADELRRALVRLPD